MNEGMDANSILVEGNQATGGHTAQALTLTAGYLVSKDGGRAGGGDPVPERAKVGLVLGRSDVGTRFR